jgi:hypothetical protein
MMWTINRGEQLPTRSSGLSNSGKSRNCNTPSRLIPGFNFRATASVYHEVSIIV